MKTSHAVDTLLPKDVDPRVAPLLFTRRPAGTTAETPTGAVIPAKRTDDTPSRSAVDCVKERYAVFTECYSRIDQQARLDAWATELASAVIAIEDLRCIYCGDVRDDEQHAPYCSAACGIAAAND